MRSAILDENNIVTNIIVGQVEDSIPCPDEVGIGWSYDGTAFTAPVVAPPPPPTTEELMRALRAKRDGLLRGADFTQLADAPFSAAEKAAWETYRQSLRDLPGALGDTTLTMAGIADAASDIWPGTPEK